MAETHRPHLEKINRKCKKLQCINPALNIKIKKAMPLNGLKEIILLGAA